MRIIHITPGFQTGGQETMLINIVNEQVKTHDIHVIIVNKDYDENLISLFDTKVNVFLLNRPVSSRNPYYFFKLNYYILSKKPDVVHSHYEKLVKYLIPHKYKFIYTIHDTNINSQDINQNKNIVAISKSVKEDVEERTGLRPHVVYNGIKIDRYFKSDIVESYDVNNTYKLVQVSRLVHEKKGQHILIKAMRILKDRGYANLHLDLIGDGQSRKFLEALVKDLDLDNVSFLGTKSVSYLNSELYKYNLFVQPSLFEGFGLTVAEAIAAKVPVLVSNIEGPLEIIDNGKYGTFFEKGNAVDCANKIESVLNTDCYSLQKQVDDAWSFVNENFNIELTALNYLNFYMICE